MIRSGGEWLSIANILNVQLVSDAEEAVTNVTLQQPYDIRSAYNNPKYTNYTVGFADCLDYIFYETNKWRVVQV